MSKWDEYNKSLPQMEVGEILNIALAQFEDPDVAQTMAAVAIPESFGGKAGAIGDKGGSVGLWQINRTHFRDLIDYGIITVPPEVRASLDEGSEENSKRLWEEYAHPQLSDPATNAKAAWMIGWEQEPSRGPTGNAAGLEGEFNFTPWTMHRNDRWQMPPENEYERYLEGEWADKAPIDAVLYAYSQIGALDQEQQVDPFAEGPGEGGVPPEHATNPMGLEPSFFERITRVQENVRKLVPIKGKVGQGEMAMIRRHLRSDPDLLEAIRSLDFRNGMAAIVGYATDQDAVTAPKWLRPFGLAAHPRYPFLVYPLGQSVDKTGDVAKQLWDVAIGSLWNQPSNVEPSPPPTRVEQLNQSSGYE